MLSSRNLLRQALLVPMTVDVLTTTLSVGGPWAESVLGKVDWDEKERPEAKSVDKVSVALKMGLSEHSEGLKLFGRTTGKL